MACKAHPDWLSLPEDLVASIATRLTQLQDYIRFSAVCWSWNLVAANNRHRLPGHLPWLLTPAHSHPFSPAAEKSKRVCGTGPGGWVIVTDDTGQQISLFNHFIGSEIPLPSLTNINELHSSSEKLQVDRCCYVWKAVLSILAAPDSFSLQHGFVVMALYGQNKCLAFYNYKKGRNHVHDDANWVPLQYPDDQSTRHISDLICYKGRFYAVDFRGRLLLCDPPSASVLQFAPPPEPKSFHSSKRYLLESIHGELFQVVGCHRLYDSYSEVGIEVFRLHAHAGTDRSEDDKGWWVRLTDLGDQIFLLGHYASFALSSSHFTPLASCKGNWIYHNGGFCYPNSHIFIYIFYSKFEFLLLFKQIFAPRIQFLLHSHDREEAQSRWPPFVHQLTNRTPPNFVNRGQWSYYV